MAIEEALWALVKKEDEGSGSSAQNRVIRVDIYHSDADSTWENAEIECQTSVLEMESLVESGASIILQTYTWYIPENGTREDAYIIGKNLTTNFEIERTVLPTEYWLYLYYTVLSGTNLKVSAEYDFDSNQTVWMASIEESDDSK